MSYIAAYRAYDWNDTIAELGERMRRACPSARFTVLADESRGSLDACGWPKVSHTSDTSSLGLPAVPEGRVLWHNVDYGIYFLERALPDADYYLLSESDLAVNVALDPIVEQVRARKLDFVAHSILAAQPNWRFYNETAALFSRPMRALLFFMIISKRAAQCLLEARQSLGERFIRGELTTWPFCEGFVPSVLAEAGLSMAPLREFADVSHLRYRPKLSIADPDANRPGSLAHSVVGAEQFLDAVFADYPARTFVDPRSEIRRALRHESFGRTAPRAHALLLAQRDYPALAALEKEMRLNAVPVPERGPDLALCKPALVSSTHRESRHADPFREASGANSPDLASDAGFHTGEEQDPWWRVDLGADHVIDAVVLVNRLRKAERLKSFAIQGSRDGTTWVTRHTSPGGHLVSTDPEAPWRQEFADPFVARHIRLQMLGRGILHLRRVQVFGRAIVPAV